MFILCTRSLFTATIPSHGGMDTITFKEMTITPKCVVYPPTLGGGACHKHPKVGVGLVTNTQKWGWGLSQAPNTGGGVGHKHPTLGVGLVRTSTRLDEASETKHVFNFLKVHYKHTLLRPSNQCNHY